MAVDILWMKHQLQQPGLILVTDCPYPTAFFLATMKELVSTPTMSLTMVCNEIIKDVPLFIWPSFGSPLGVIPCPSCCNPLKGLQPLKFRQAAGWGSLGMGYVHSSSQFPTPPVIIVVNICTHTMSFVASSWLEPTRMAHVTPSSPSGLEQWFWPSPARTPWPKTQYVGISENLVPHLRYLLNPFFFGEGRFFVCLQGRLSIAIMQYFVGQRIFRDPEFAATDLLSPIAPSCSRAGFD